MTEGFYVIRVPHKGTRWIVESRCFSTDDPKFEEDWVQHRANGWRDFIQHENPKDDVFLVKVIRNKE